MQIYAIGLHKNNITNDTWEQAPANPQAIKSCCRTLSSFNISKESLLVISCHSIEIFALLEGDINKQKEILKKFLAKMLNLEESEQNVYFHNLEGPEAVRHFLNLALGVEPIAYESENDFLECASKGITLANEFGNADFVLNRLYQTAILLAAKVEQSGISFDHASIYQQIEDLMKKIFGSLESIAILLVGTNALSAPLLNSLQSKPLKDVFYIMSTSEYGTEFIALSEKQIVPPHELNDKLARVQVVLRMNQDSSEYFTSDNLHNIMAQRKNQPLLIANLDTTIIPEALLNRIYNLFVYDLNDFQNFETVSQSANKRTKDLIENELKDFFSWFYSKEHYRFGDIIGKSRLIEGVLELIARISQTNITVLIQGESGTGKELVAKAIHENSPRSKKPFVTVNCGALPETLLESELFGYERGAFTGAHDSKRGLLEEADGGTLMLDEIGDTSPAFQVKLLRVLQEGEMRRVGSTRSQHIDVRIIAATNKQLDGLVAKGNFRKDLYYRLKVVNIDLPALRDRREDILLLARHFIAHYSDKMKKRVTGLDNSASDIIMQYNWPGNVRELENAIEHAVALSIGHTILPEDLPTHLHRKEEHEVIPENGRVITLKEMEKQYITKALQHYRWDYDLVARALEIGRTTLWRKMKEYEIEKPSEH